MFAKISVCSMSAMLMAAVLAQPGSPMFLAAQEKPKVPDAIAQEAPKLPDGVIHVALPPGEVRMESIVRNDRALIRLTVGKTVIDARAMFLGNSKGASHFEAIKEGIHWAPASGGKGFIFGNGSVSIREPGSTIGDPDYYALDKLKAGSVFLTSPSIRFLFGQAAKPRPTGREGLADAKPKVQDGPYLADGVIHVALPLGELRQENFLRSGKPLIRVTVGKTVIEARSIFFGDAKGATHYEAVKEGIHWAPASGGKGFVIDGRTTYKQPGSTIGDPDFHPLGTLKAGSLFITTPQIRFLFGAEALPVGGGIAEPKKEKPRKPEGKAPEALKLPDGVIHVALPPGEVRMENIARNGKVLIRLSVDKTVVEAQTMFLGDSKGATRFESTKEGIHWAPASGGKGFIFANGSASTREPGSTIGDPDFHALDKLKAGSVFLTTPSVRFVFGQAAKPRPTGREGAAEAKAKEQDGPNLPDGVIHVAMPPGAVRIEDVDRRAKVLRVTVGKTATSARVVFLGDGKGATPFDAKEEQGNILNFAPGLTFGDEDFVPVNKLKAGGLYVTTPSIIFRWGNEARLFSQKGAPGIFRLRDKN